MSGATATASPWRDAPMSQHKEGALRWPSETELDRLTIVIIYRIHARNVVDPATADQLVGTRKAEIKAAADRAEARSMLSTTRLADNPSNSNATKLKGVGPAATRVIEG